MGLGVGFAMVSACGAATFYVDINSTNPVPPFSDWSTAATNIQDAVDVSSAGDQVLVNDGVYRAGGRVVSGSTTNRVAITQALTVRSLNGPGATRIEGSTNGPVPTRCAYLGSNALLDGFILTNGGTYSSEVGAGALLSQKTSVLSNCVLTGCFSGGWGGGAAGGSLVKCVIKNNIAFFYGGGVSDCTLTNCIVQGNSTRGPGSTGGGAENCTLINCLLAGNSTRNGGGGLYAGKLIGCTVISNSVTSTNTLLGGGGIGNGTLVANCVIYFNS